MVSVSLVGLLLVALQLITNGCTQGTRRTLSKWHGDNDLTRQEETVMELLKDNPWAHFSVREGGRNTVNFSPRLGRDEEVVFTETSRSPPFAPRLGRIVFRPRFGRLTLAAQH
uniref:PBAN-type neuropeptide n=1 Tax=Rhodnius prolixus TaxID=13249 RepID=D2XQ64_RHOPR|nr:PBAN-type neuropeptide precursor [Rhodnius prolixus]